MVALQFGQGGNQVGEQFFDRLLDELDDDSYNFYFRDANAASSNSPPRLPDYKPSLVARSVLVDTEPKVVQRAALNTHSGRWRFDNDNVFYKQSGAANNWAQGYHAYGGAVGEVLLEKVSREVERADRLDGFLLLNSVAGGTGSGLGSYFGELLADVFPTSARVVVNIWPFESGEITVQSYNTLLSTVAASDTADLVLLFENQRYKELCSRTLRVKNPSFNDLNNAMTENLVQVLKPIRKAGLSGFHSPLSVLVRQLGHPAYKFATPRSVPQISNQALLHQQDSWNALSKGLVGMFTRGDIVDASIGGVPAKPMKAYASSVFLRGPTCTQAPLDMFSQLSGSSYLDPLSIHLDKTRFKGLDRSAALLSNDQSCLKVFESVIDKASQMFRGKVYLHQYEPFGVTREEFGETLLSFNQLIESYRQLGLEN